MRTFHYATLHSGEGVALGDYVCRARAGAAGPEELPSRDQIVFVRAGVFLVDVRGETLVGSPNHVLLLRRDVPYRVRHPLDGGDECTVIVLEPGVVEESSNGRAVLEGRRARTAPGRAFLLQQRLVTALRRREPLTRLWIDEALCALLDGALDTERPRPGPGPRAATDRRHRDCVEAAIAFLGSRLGANPSLAEVARHVGVSSFHLSRIFRRRTGWPLHRFQRSLRLRAAAVRIAGGERDLTRLALELGFSDHSHFTNSFRRELGVAPSEVRRSTGVEAEQDPASPRGGGERGSPPCSPPECEPFAPKKKSSTSSGTGTMPSRRTTSSATSASSTRT